MPRCAGGLVVVRTPLHLVGETYLVRCLRCPLREKPGFRWPWIGFIASGWSLPGLAAAPSRGTAARLRYRGPPPFGGTPLASLVTTASAGRMGSWGRGHALPAQTSRGPGCARGGREPSGARGARAGFRKGMVRRPVQRGSGSARADVAAAGSAEAGPGATGLGWAPPYLRSRLAKISQACHKWRRSKSGQSVSRNTSSA